MSRDDRLAIASDPDRDRVWIADIASGKLVASIELQPGDEPGRLVEDDTHWVHVALRRGGAIATISLDSLRMIARIATCAEPRGIAFDSKGQMLHVACMSGDLLTYVAGEEKPRRTLHLKGDLRDVIVQGDSLWVSRFRTAEILIVNRDGVLVKTIQLPTYHDNMHQIDFEPGTAYRMVAQPNGGVAILHQRASLGDIKIDDPTGGYGSPATCNSTTLHTAVSLVSPTFVVDTPPPHSDLVVAVDLALSPLGYTAITASPGSLKHKAFTFTLVGPDRLNDSCATSTPISSNDQIDKSEITAVAVDSNGNLILQSREPAQIIVTPLVASIAPPTAFQGVISLSGAKSVADFGHAVFHRDGGRSIACASCHPEGHDDGRVWSFVPTGARRTQSLRVGLTGTAPFHWDGNFTNLEDLVAQVFVRRMAGPALNAKQTDLLTHWITNIPSLVRDVPQDETSAQRGAVLFRSSEVGCASCHSGGKYTNNATVDVGTGGMFQVPSLIGVGARAPYLHDGCAKSLRDRFGACGGGDLHGNTSGLTASQIDDLIAFLETL